MNIPETIYCDSSQVSFTVTYGRQTSSTGAQVYSVTSVYYAHDVHIEDEVPGVDYTKSSQAYGVALEDDICKVDYSGSDCELIFSRP